jgi:hypothetical protein
VRKLVESTRCGPLHSWNTCPIADIRSVTNEARLPRSHMGRKRTFKEPPKWLKGNPTSVGQNCGEADSTVSFKWVFAIRIVLTSAQSPFSSSTMHYGIYFWIGERRLKFCFPSGDESTAPVWADSDFPPLPPRQAALSAEQFLKSQLPDSGASLKCYKLRKTWGPKSNDCYWYYAIEFVMPDPEDVGADSSLVEIPVLFDGLVPPLIESPYQG